MGRRGDPTLDGDDVHRRRHCPQDGSGQNRKTAGAREHHDAGRPGAGIELRHAEDEVGTIGEI